MLYHLKETASSFYFIYFLNRVSILCLSSLDHLTIYVSNVVGMTGMYHCAQLLLAEIRGSQQILGWAGLKP
jgi:hypothetical protein